MTCMSYNGERENPAGSGCGRLSYCGR
jgi:hypothetical protein